MVHELLHHYRAVCRSKGHYYRGVQAFHGFKGQYVFAFFGVSNVIVPFLEVKFTKQYCSFGIFNYAVDSWKGHNIFDCPFIDRSVVK